MPRKVLSLYARGDYQIDKAGHLISLLTGREEYKGGENS